MSDEAQALLGGAIVAAVRQHDLRVSAVDIARNRLGIAIKASARLFFSQRIEAGQNMVTHSPPKDP